MVTLTVLVVLTAGVFAGVYRGVLSRGRAAVLLVLVGILTAVISAVAIGGKAMILHKLADESGVDDTRLGGSA